MKLFKKIAVTAVSALALSGISVITAMPASAAITGITSVSTVPTRASSLSGGVANASGTDNQITISMIASTDTTSTTNGVVGETATIRGRIISSPTPLLIDETSQISANDTLVGVAFLANNAASNVVLSASSDTVTVLSSTVLANAFRTAGTYRILLWIDNVGPVIGGNSSIDGGEAYFTAEVKVGGIPVTLETTSSSLATAGNTATDIGVTLKDATGTPTLLRWANEWITVSSSILAGSTETLTVTRGKVTDPGTVLTVLSRPNTPASNTFLDSSDSITASTGTYNLNVRHSGATSSTISFNLGGFLVPNSSKVVNFTTSALAKATKIVPASLIGISTSTTKYEAPVAVETNTTKTYYASMSNPSIGWIISGTAGSIVNVVISNSTVSGVTNGTYPVTIGSDGTATHVVSATTTSGSYTITVEMASGNAVITTNYIASGVAQGPLGSNGITTSVLSPTITSAVTKIGSSTAIKINVKNNFNIPQQYYFVTASLSSTSRNFGTVFAPTVTDVNGDASIVFMDKSISVTNFTDTLSIQVTAPGTSTGLLSSGNSLTITYSDSGAYSSLTIDGGSTITTELFKDIQLTTAGNASAVTFVPSLKNSAGSLVNGVALVITASDGVIIRTANPTVRPSTGDVNTATIGSGETFTAIGTKSGTATVTVVGGGLVGSAKFTVNVATATTARNITATSVGGRVTAKVTDGFGNSVKGISVNFAVDSKGIFGNGVTSTSSITDANGETTAIVQSADGKDAIASVTASLVVTAQSADLADSPVIGFAKGSGSTTVSASLPAVTVVDAISVVKADVATTNAAVKALATQVTVLQASVATLIDSLSTQIASLMKTMAALTKSIASIKVSVSKVTAKK